MKKQILLIIFVLFAAAGRIYGQCTAGDITGSSSVCVGSTIALTAHPSGGTPGYTFEWTSSNTTIATVDNSGNVTAGAGTGTTDIQYRFTDSNSTPCTSDWSNAFTLQVISTVSSGAITGTSPVCQGTTGVSFSISAVGGATSYIWTLPSGASIASGAGTNTVSVDFSGSAVSGDISVAAVNSCGTGAASSMAVTVNSVPEAAGAITGSTTVCKNTTGIPFSVGSITGATSYTWSLPAGATIASGANTNSITVDFSGTAASGDISVKGTNSCGDGTASVFSLTVGSLPDAAGAITGISPVCQASTGKTYSVGSITGATGYTWTVPAGSSIVSGSGTESITVDFSGTAVSGNVTVAGTNGCGAGPVSSFPVTVNPLPSAAGTISGTSALCQGNTGVSFSVPSITNATDYVWTLPAGATIATGSNTRSITVDFSGTAVSGTVSVYGTNSCGNGSASNFSVTVNPMPTLSAATQPVNACSGSPAVIHLTGLVPNSVSTVAYSIAGTAKTPVTGVTANSSGIADFSTANVTTSNDGDNLQITSITITSSSPSCPKSFSTTLVLHVDQLPTLTSVSQSATVCDGTGALIEIAGLIAGTTSTINYTIDGSPYSKTNVSANGSGDASFTSVPLTAANNGKRIYITGLTNTGWTSGCSSTVSKWDALSVNPIPQPSITGSTNVCAGSTGNTYTTASSKSNYVWTITGGTITSGGTTKTATVTWGASGAGTLRVSYDDNGCTGTSTVFNVSINPNPSPSISGPSSACLNSSNNIYSTQSGMLSYSWSVSSGGTITSANDGNYITVTWSSSGAKTVTVSYSTPGGCTTAPGTLNLQVKPSISDLSITFPTDPKIGATMHASYHYTDGTTGDGTGCTFRWFRDGTVIGSATGIDYIAQSADFNKALTVEVTPVSSVCPAFSGIAVLSDPTPPIEDLTSPGATPYADLVCIDGIREAGKTLTGRYRYNCIKSEGASTFRWIRKDSLTLVEEVIGTSISHIVTNEDLKTDKVIYFEVTPVTSNYNPITGPAKRSKPMAKIFGLKDQYSIAEPDALLTSNVTGGSFIGNGIITTPTQVFFSPSKAGEGNHTITYLLFYDNSAFTCSQRSPQLVNVDPDIPQFSTVNPVYCHDASAFTVDVSNIKVGSVYNDFILEGPKGIYSDALTNQFFGYDVVGRIDHITINPYVLNPGRNKLTYSYQVQKTIIDIFGMPRFYILTYSNSVEFIVDYVSEYIKFINLGTKYCKSADDVYISVEGINPYEGTPHWTGSFLSDQKVNSAVFSPSDGTIGSTYNISYYYESPLGCLSQTLNANVTINAMPDAGFSLDPSYNVEGPYEKLIPSQWGGEFSGRGVSGGILFPDIAKVGKDTITYKITDINRCTNTLSKYTEIRKAEGTITGVNNVVCYDTPVHTITVTGLPSTGIIQKNGFSDQKHTIAKVAGASTATFDARLTDVGTDTVYFSYKWDGVDYEIFKVVDVENLGKVDIFDLRQNQKFCDDTVAFPLNVLPAGGVFSGPVYIDPSDHKDYFNPKAGTPVDTVKYIYTSAKGCTVDTSIYIHVYKAPVVDFAPADLCIDNSTDVTMFNNLTVHSDPVVKWEWKFTDESDETKNTSDSRENGGYLYLKGGLHKASLTAVTDKGCEVTKEKTFTLARKPEADFYWKKDCFHPGLPNDSLLLFDATTYTTIPKEYIWIKEGDILHKTGLTESYGKPAAGYIRISHVVTTNTPGCYDTVVKDIYVRPTFSIPPDGKFEDFESGNGGWVRSDNSSIWSFGTPSGTILKSASSGNYAWFTAVPQNDTASIESPCYDFSSLTRPLIKLKIQKALDKERDGVALQYRVGDERKWHTVGTLNDGINWYNSATISGEPGGSQVGWTTPGSYDTQFQTASHTLDELTGSRDVVFRMTYGSEGSKVNHDGFMFDDIFIGDRTRHVLVEHFMNIADAKSSEVKSLVDTIAEHKKADVINIQYHTNFPGNDRYYSSNPGEINARILYYGLTRVPYTFVDGGNDPKMHAMVFDHLNAELDSNAISKRSLVGSPFLISLDPQIDGRLLTVNGSIKAIEKIDSANLTLFIVVTEKRNTEGGTSYLNIFRKFIPDAGGILLKNNWSPGDLETVSRSWTIDRSLDATSIEIIAFLQNRITQQVYQSSSVIKPRIAVGIDDSSLPGHDYTIYPNPASDRITVAFGHQLSGSAVIRIYGIGGEILREYKAGSGSTELIIEDPGLKGGIYMMRVMQGKIDLGYRKLIITDN